MGIRVNKGDTLSAIAKLHNTSVAELKRLNPQIKDEGKIQAGWTLKLPVDAAKMPGKNDGFSTAPPRPSTSAAQLTGVGANNAPARPTRAEPPAPPELPAPAELPAAPELAAQELPIASLPQSELPAPARPELAPPAEVAQGPAAPVAKTFTTPAGGKSANGNYKIPACTFPTFDALSSTQQAMLGPTGRKTYEQLSPEQRACFLNITSAMKKAGIDLSGIQVKSFESDRIFIEPKGLDELKGQLEKNSGFDYDKPEGNFHPGMTDWGVRQGTDFNSLQVGLGPKGGFIDIDRGDPKASVAGLFVHLSEVLTPGKTNPFAIGKQFGAEQTGYTEQK